MKTNYEVTYNAEHYCNVEVVVSEKSIEAIRNFYEIRSPDRFADFDQQLNYFLVSLVNFIFHEHRLPEIKEGEDWDSKWPALDGTNDITLSNVQIPDFDVCEVEISKY